MVRILRSPVRHGVVLAAIAIAGACMLGAAGTDAAASGAAFVRVNQVGYPTGSAKRAYLLSSVPEPGAAFQVTNARGRVVFSAPVGASLGRWSARFPHVYAIDFSRVRVPGTYTIAVTGPAPAASPRFRIAARQRALGAADPQCALVLPERARRPQLHPHRAAHGARAPERRRRDDVPDAEGGRRRQLRRQPHAARRADQRGRGLVGRRRLPQVRRDRELHRHGAALGAARLPPPDARPRPRLELCRRGEVRRALAAADVGRQDAHALLPGRDRRGQRPHDRRPRHLAAAAGRRPLRRHEPRRALHPPPAGVPGRAAGLARQPEPGRPRCRRLRPLLPGVPAHGAGACGPLPALRRAHLRAREHAPRPAADGGPVRLLPRDGVARRSRARRHRARHRDRARPPPGRAAAHGARATTCGWPPTGLTPTSPGPTMPPTRSTCTT